MFGSTVAYGDLLEECALLLGGNAMRSSAESCGGIGFFGHSTFVQPQAVVTSIRTSGCFEVLVARRETWRVVPSRTSPSDSIERSNLSASSVSTSGLSKSTVCSNAARFSSASPAEGFGGPPQANRSSERIARRYLFLMRLKVPETYLFVL